MPRRLLAAVTADLQRAFSSYVQPTHADIQKVIRHVPACVFVVDANGRLVAASHMALATVGHTATSLRELTIVDLAAEAEHEHVEPLWESFRRERQQTGTYLLRRKDGTPVRTEYAAAANVVGDLSVAVHVVADRDQPTP